ADVDAGVLVELVAVVADRDRPGPVLAVVVGERGLDRRAARPVELGPGHVDSAEMMPGRSAGVDHDRLMVRELAVAALLGTGGGPGRHRDRVRPGGRPVALVLTRVRIGLRRIKARRQELDRERRAHVEGLADYVEGV